MFTVESLMNVAAPMPATDDLASRHHLQCDPPDLTVGSLSPTHDDPAPVNLRLAVDVTEC
ncbi:hypothetical protein BKD30_08235 [Tersicoccus phoenicis]|uniref:Uncharacterized protein n=1 Tax=Tersicoccus phoenicis TaxID=554083 RepID=A0A1R1LAK0_9MICC|nr:hypothetical protein BKD30_08235 [Tersicoccus phoenicis]